MGKLLDISRCSFSCESTFKPCPQMQSQRCIHCCRTCLGQEVLNDALLVHKLLCHHACGGLWIIVISFHHLRSSEQQLSFFFYFCYLFASFTVMYLKIVIYVFFSKCVLCVFICVVGFRYIFLCCFMFFYVVLCFYMFLLCFYVFLYVSNVLLMLFYICRCCVLCFFLCVSMFMFYSFSLCFQCFSMFILCFFLC